MRLPEGIIVNKEETFGKMKFSALRREVFVENEEGTITTEVKERTYDLKSKAQGMMIQVSIPGSVPLKEFKYNEEVDIVNPKVNTVATPSFRGADVEWYMKADDIILAAADKDAPKDNIPKDGAKERTELQGGQKPSGGQPQGEQKK